MKLSKSFRNAAGSAVKTAARAAVEKTGLRRLYDLYSGAALLKANGIAKSRIAPLRGTGACVAGGISAGFAAYAPFSAGPANPLFAEPVVSHAAHYAAASALVLALYGGVLWATAGFELYQEKVLLPRERAAQEKEAQRRQDYERGRLERSALRAQRRAAPAPQPQPQP
jgi:hypothetical protein